jgi:hypothetical protein
MAITLRGSNQQSLSTPVTTNAGDLLAIACAGSDAVVQSSAHPPTTTGGNATWTLFGIDSSGSVLSQAVWIGSNCDSGITAFAFPSGYGPQSYACAVFSGCSLTAPTTAATGYSGSTAAATTSSLSYGAGDLVIGFSAAYTLANATVSWSNGVSDIAVQSRLLAHAYCLSYIVPVTSGSTTYTSPADTNSWVTCECIDIASSSPPPPVANGNFFAFFGD